MHGENHGISYHENNVGVLMFGQRRGRMRRDAKRGGGADLVTASDSIHLPGHRALRSATGTPLDPVDVAVSWVDHDT
jgi:hypothetical protein